MIADESVNQIGLEKNSYRGSVSTLCKGCGHNSVANQVIAACYEHNIPPEKIIKFSGIGCSSKSLNYFINRAFGFNGLHGRMPSLALGALFADTSLKGIGISGDGDTASIGLGQFKHLIRRNIPMVYIVENNGVYGLTKGQFSPTSEKDLKMKRLGVNPYMPIDICMEALSAYGTFVARSFAGDPQQVKRLIKAGLSHDGIAVIDIISPCVSFHNLENSIHSYTWGKDHESPLHELTFVPPREEITIEDFERGSMREVVLHDGSIIMLKKLGADYDPTDRGSAFNMLAQAEKNNLLVTGLIYVDPKSPSLMHNFNLPDTPLNRLPADRLRPAPETLDKINQTLL